MLPAIAPFSEVPSDPTIGSQLGHLAPAAQGSTGSEPQGQQAALAALSNPAGIGNNATDLLAGLHGNPYQGQGLPGYGVANLMAARQAAPQGFGQMNPQLLQLQQQLGYAAPQVSPMHANSAQLMAALGLPNPSAPMSGFGLESLLGRMQQPSASAINEGYIQQLMAAGGGGLLNHGMNPAAALGGLQGLGGAASGRDQLLSLLASAVAGSNGLATAAGGNQTAAALLLAQLNGGGGTASARSSDPPGSTSGLASIKRARDDVDAEKARAIAALENKPLIPNPGLMGRDPIQLYMTCDDERLSAYHALARKHIDFFEANKDDISTNARGRNRPIVLGQVGIRCRHCSHLPPRRRQRAAMYYPFKLDLLYQYVQSHIYCVDHAFIAFFFGGLCIAILTTSFFIIILIFRACQTLANVHLCEQCQHFPADVRAELVKLRGEKTTALVVSFRLFWFAYISHIFSLCAQLVLLHLSCRAKSTGPMALGSTTCTKRMMDCALGLLRRRGKKKRTRLKRKAKKKNRKSPRRARMLYLLQGWNSQLRS